MRNKNEELVESRHVTWPSVERDDSQLSYGCVFGTDIDPCSSRERLRQRLVKNIHVRNKTSGLDWIRKSVGS